jgi:hypothetical protein
MSLKETSKILMDQQTYERGPIVEAATRKAREWEPLVTLSVGSLEELHSCIISDFPTKAGIKRLRELLVYLPLTKDHPYELPWILPIEEPFHTPYTASFLITRIKRLKNDREKDRQLKLYLTPEKEDEILTQVLKIGTEDLIIFDLPELVSRSVVLRKLKPRLLRVFEGIDERIGILNE